MTPIISIIVPIYNVENYIRECIDSILNQTLKNIEVILINDGSPDKCPSICEEYARQDSRVIVIHQNNQGSSSARNSGIKIATGKYLAFVDSDDIISPLMFETLINNGKNADIIECNVTQHKEKLQISKEFFQIKEYRENILAEYLKSNKVGVWCRIYRREMIQNIAFEVGAFSEDVMWSYRAFEQCKSYLVINAVLYYWRQCSNSLSKSSIKHFKSQSERLAKIISEEHPELYPIINNHLIIIKINLLTNAIRYGFANKDIEKEFYNKQKPKALYIVRHNLFHILTNSFFRWQTKLKAIVICLSYSLYSAIIKKTYEK
jgi:glycosyltransferase involved in cell wall biosynthesis